MPFSLTNCDCFVKNPLLLYKFKPDINSVGPAPPFFATRINLFAELFWLGLKGKILKDPEFFSKYFKTLWRISVGKIINKVPLFFNKQIEIWSHFSKSIILLDVSLKMLFDNFPSAEW
jgi:hypothetical protein